jgi:hypothetical protein
MAKLGKNGRGGKKPRTQSDVDKYLRTPPVSTPTGRR